MHDMILDSLEKCCRIGKIKPVCSIYNLFLFLSLSLDSFYCWLISYMVWFLCKTHYWFAKYVHLLCTRNQAIRIWKKARKSFLSHGTRKKEPPFHPFSFHSQNRWDRFFSSAHMHAINNFFDIGVVISPVFSARSQMEEKKQKHRGIAYISCIFAECMRVLLPLPLPLLLLSFQHFQRT